MKLLYVLVVMHSGLSSEPGWQRSEFEFVELTQCNQALANLHFADSVTGFGFCERRQQVPA